MGLEFSTRQKNILKIIEKYDDAKSPFRTTRKYEWLLWTGYAVTLMLWIYFISQDNVAQARAVLNVFKAICLVIIFNYFTDMFGIIKKYQQRLHKLEK